jgi:dihydrodipicolinate synthase/N-acetylneuraminate lyase
MERVGELEHRVSRRKLKRTRARRARRIAFGLGAAMLLAGSAGAYVGYTTHTTPQEVMEAQDAARRREGELSSEVNRTLLELWKMEDVESLRNVGRTR